MSGRTKKLLWGLGLVASASSNWRKQVGYHTGVWPLSEYSKCMEGPASCRTNQGGVEPSFVPGTFASKLHVYLVPKSASRTLVHVLATAVAEIIMHDHTDGCRLARWCNATALIPGERSIAVLREPCDRFASMYYYLKKAAKSSSFGLLMADGRRFWERDYSMVELAETLARLRLEMAGDPMCEHSRQPGDCPGRFGCLNTAKKELKASHTPLTGCDYRDRGFIYPAAFYVDPNRTSVVCFTRNSKKLCTHIEDAASRELRIYDVHGRCGVLNAAPHEATGTRSAASVSQDIRHACEIVRVRVWPEDVPLWKEKCGRRSMI
ncbi:hypothetical protein T492DRAFT_993941 [Pavlovales sp. CCMP2436]|nr:hypothetical protein T492DRAFT_993941 [Pavlovales sp. CCMP2436]|mmetsp:Transcript_1852/g.4905  ORF Transcript_1852/g.4905 Transcript_1852/m.4905 type:complete len:321 (-) Transcript_1852:264-1226(-)